MKEYKKERRLAECAKCYDSSKEKNKTTLWCNCLREKEKCSTIKDCGNFDKEITISKKEKK